MNTRSPSTTGESKVEPKKGGYSCIEQRDVTPTDEDLMRAIQQRDPAALKTLLDRYQGVLRSSILRIVHDHAGADDVLQECLLEIWRRADHYNSAKGNPLGWIITVGKRRAIDYLRRSTAYCGAKNRLENETRVSSSIHDARTECEDADMSQVIREHLSRLPLLQQEVVILAFLHGMSQREVAHALHTPLGTVKTRIELGLKKLRSSFRTRTVMSSSHGC